MSPDAARIEMLSGGSVLVTGATGKVGRRLVPALQEQGARVSVLTRDPDRARDLWPDGGVDYRAGDLTDPATLPDVLHGVVCIFHLASYSPSSSEPDVYEAPSHWPVTAEGTRNLVHAARAAGVECLVYLSSVKAMGDRVAAAGTPADESTHPAPESLYGRAKLAAENSVLSAGEGGGMHVCVLRLPMVYGLMGQGNIARMIVAVARNRFPPWPKIENRRVAVHVDDAIRAALLAACSPRAAGRVYLVTDGRAYSTRWLYEQICLALGRSPPGWTLPLWTLRAAAAIGSALERVTGRAMPLNRTGLGKLTGDAWYSSQKIGRDLGFAPQRDLEAEIPRMVRDYLHAGSQEPV